MRACVLLIVALVLTGCASVRPATRSATPGAPTSAANKRAAERDVAQLLSRFAEPPHAAPLRSVPPHARWWLQSKWVVPHGPVADAHHLWRVDAPHRAVVAFVKAHEPAGAQLRFSNSSRADGRYSASHHFGFSFPSVPGRIYQRFAEVVAVPLGRNVTALRIDVIDNWVWKQTPSDRLPAGVREIDITRPRWAGMAALSLRVAKPREVRRVVGWVRGLDVVPPRTGCPIEGPLLTLPPVTVAFRGAGGSVLAQLRFLGLGVGPSTLPACHAMEYTVRGRPRPRLAAGEFVKRLEQLVAAKFYY